MADSAFGFKNVSEYGLSLVTDQLETAVYSWLGWGLLAVGGFDNVALGAESAQGDRDRSRLRPVDDPRYASGTVWQGLRTDWVWESGVPYATQPVAVSGVWVNSGFVPGTGVGTYAHTVDYPQGRVVFASAVPATAVVQCEHSYRHVQVRRADEPWFQQIAYRSFRADDSQWEQAAGSGGAWDILAQNRIQLPALVVEPVARVSLKPLEVGGSARIHQQDVLVHVLAETPWERNRLHDMLVEQYDKRIPSFDVNAAPVPLDWDGAIASGAQTYPQLVSGYPWRQIRISNVQSSDNESLGDAFHWCTVRLALETDVA